MKKSLEKIGNCIFYTGVLVAAYGLYQIYINRKGLPPGVCPVNENRTIMYLAISMFIISLILYTIYDFKEKKRNKEMN
ncbi:hypothetical protein [Anaerosalibacter massiliensis]|uniref:Uncharacterized protein n=1 Tax=Anaerosalibacter massiliensis TaxID=1347392 RepID=A0A9X2MHH5_9FIRM|nr:hypothetical protein [Anaerosalibacter massiliensis]MCR2044118.1 hypothetical protein [Anaerosalibacter massiliensis]